MSNYTIKSGDTVSGILYKLGFRGKQLWAECAKVKEMNKLDANYTIFAGKTLQLADNKPGSVNTNSVWTTQPVGSKNPTDGQGVQPTSTDAPTPVANQPQNVTLGTVDKWYVGTTTSNLLAKDDERAAIEAYSQEHPGYKPEELAPIGEKLGDNLFAIEKNGVNLLRAEDVNAFCTQGPNGTMTVDDVYAKGLVSAAKDTIKSVNLDDDATTMSRDEFEAQQKEIQTQTAFGRMDKGSKDQPANNLVSYDEFESYYMNTHPDEFSVPSDVQEKFKAMAKDKGGIDINDVRSNPAMFGYDKAAVDKAFGSIDLDGNGKIDYKEQASVYATMDTFDAKRKPDGTVIADGRDGIIKSSGAISVYEGLGLYKDGTDDDKKDRTQDLSELKNKFSLYRRCFEKY